MLLSALYGYRPASLRLEVHPPPDGAPVILWAHESCFAILRDSSVDYDDPKDHGRIPGKARCVFCGNRLPMVGTHPYVLDVGSILPARRFWAHAPCLLERFVPSLAEQLDVTGRGSPERGGTA